MKISIVAFVVALLAGLGIAKSQTKFRYEDALKLTVVGKMLPDQSGFKRIDTAAYPNLPSNVKRLLNHSAGLAISFNTNSTTISAKWCVTVSKAALNLTAIANKGLDLYIKKNGKWQFAGVGRPDKVCSESVIVKNMDKGEKECLLYLPLYDETKSLEIGVEESATLQAAAEPFKRRILIYGSSIVHGASASRPGMAYPAILSRATGLNFLNMGVSGSAKMEKEVADLVAKIPADAYILDCVPNSSPEEITERTANLVNTIRKHHPAAPIIVLPTIVREGGFFDQSIGKRVAQQNINIKKEVDLLLKNGVKDLFFISTKNLLGTDHDGTTDGTHPNDLGFSRMVEAWKPEIVRILKQYGL